jgi:hypothetical protein
MAVVTSFILNGNPANPTSVTLNLDRPWTVAPDGTSHVDVTTSAFNSVFYMNTLQTAAGANGAAAASSIGFNDYSGGYNLVFDSNTVTNTQRGVLITSAGTDNPAFFVQVLNNQFNNMIATGVVLGQGYTNALNDPNFLGTAIRGNSVNTAAIAAFDLAWLKTGTDALTVLEHNTTNNSPIGIFAYTDPDVLAYKNTFDAGSSNGPQSAGISYANSASTILLRQNTYQNFAAHYANAPAGSMLDLPLASTSVTISASNPNQFAIPLWNSGDSSVAWTATTDTSWLSLVVPGGNIAGENASSAATFYASTLALSPGTYAVTITFNFGGQTKKAVITVNVTA